MTLVDKIRDIIKGADIQAGVAIWHIESGVKLNVNGDEPFPMASTFKIPILATACQQLTAGVLSLDMRVPLSETAGAARLHTRSVAEIAADKLAQAPPPQTPPTK